MKYKKGYKERILEYAEEINRAFCVHEISDWIGNSIRNTSGFLSSLTKSGQLITGFNKDTCKFSDIKHTFYIYANKKKVPEEPKAEIPGAAIEPKHEEKPVKTYRKEYENLQESLVVAVADMTLKDIARILNKKE